MAQMLTVEIKIPNRMVGLGKLAWKCVLIHLATLESLDLY